MQILCHLESSFIIKITLMSLGIALLSGQIFLGARFRPPQSIQDPHSSPLKIPKVECPRASSRALASV